MRNIKQQLEEVSKRGEDVDKIIHKAMHKLVIIMMFGIQNLKPKKRIRVLSHE